MKRRFKANL